MTFLLLLAIAASEPIQYQPTSPTVGDLITITFPDPGEGKLSLLPSDEFEVVEVSGAKAVVRTFRPGTIRVVAETLTPGEQTLRHSAEIEIRSVLVENDDLQPAPLVLPKELPRDTRPLWLIAGAAAIALAIWLLLFRVAPLTEESEGAGATDALNAAQAYLERLNRIARLTNEDECWRQLADAVRWILPRIDRSLGLTLTSSEIIAMMQSLRFDQETILLVNRILHGGDWAKFSPFGAVDHSSAAVLQRARSLAGLYSERKAA